VVSLKDKVRKAREPKQAPPAPPVEDDVPQSIEETKDDGAGSVKYACPDGGWVNDTVCAECKKRDGCPVR
jgi:hypothetical protein